MCSLCLPFSTGSRARPPAAAALPPDPFRPALTSLSSTHRLHLHIPVWRFWLLPEIQLFPSNQSPLCIAQLYRYCLSAKSVFVLTKVPLIRALLQLGRTTWTLRLCPRQSASLLTCTFINVPSTSSKSLIKVIFHYQLSIWITTPNNYPLSTISYWSLWEISLQVFSHLLMRVSSQTKALLRSRKNDNFAFSLLTTLIVGGHLADMIWLSHI